MARIKDNHKIAVLKLGAKGGAAVAKEIKVIHINDGSEKMLTNGNFHYAEEFAWTGEVLSEYVNAGYRIVSIMTDYTPYPEKNSFFKTGFNVILEREVSPDNQEITGEDWKKLNPGGITETQDDPGEYILDEEDEIALLDEEEWDLLGEEE